MAVDRRMLRQLVTNSAPPAVGGGGGGASLKDLTLTASDILPGFGAGDTIGFIGNKTEGSIIEIRGASGRAVPNSDFSKLIVGLTSAKTTFPITLREIHPTLGTKDTSFNIGVGAITPLDPMNASQSPWGLYGFSRLNPTYGTGACYKGRDSANQPRTVSFNTDGTLAAAVHAGWGDGVSFTIDTLYDHSGNARHLTTTTRPILYFPNNFATLVNVPAIGNGGTGYSVNDVLTATGGYVSNSGGIAAQVRVTAVSGGVITAVSVERAGKYKHSPSPTNSPTGVTGGTGTGATFIWALTPDAGNVYNTIPEFDTPAATLFLASTDTSLNVGGTANLAVFLVAARYGYGGAYTNRPGAPTTSAATALVGYGTLNTGILIGGAPLATSTQNSQMTPQSVNIGRDTLGRSASAYNIPERMPLDETAPAVNNGYANIWFNQKGAQITGGGDQRIHWSNRLHGVAAANGQRLVMGASGNGLAGNAGFRELIVFNPAAAPLSDLESLRIAYGQRQRHGTVDTICDPRYAAIYLGQSNTNGQLDVSSSGDGTAGTASAERRWKPKLATYLGINQERIQFGFSSRTTVGGSAMMKRGMPGDAARQSYWWDEDTNGPGTLMKGQVMAGDPVVVSGGSGYAVNDILTLVGGNLVPGATASTVKVMAVGGGGAITDVDYVNAGNYIDVPTGTLSFTGGSGTGATFTENNWAGGLLPYLDSLMTVLQYKTIILVHGQGEEDSKIAMDSARILAWLTQTYLFLDYVRNYMGQPFAPIILQPLARYTINTARVNEMRRGQTSYLGTKPNVFIAADTGHIARGTSNNFEAHFGTLAVGGFDPTTGTAEDGYQRLAWQNAKATAYGLRRSIGVDIVANDNWRGPEIDSVTKTAANKLFWATAFPPGCAGTDIQTPSGQYAGFRVNVSGTDYLGTAHTKKTIGGKVGIEVTYAAADIPIGSPCAYEPNYASGAVEGANVRNQLVDDNAELNMPVASSPLMSVAA